MQAMIGPTGFGRPATEAEAQAFRAELPWVKTARLLAYIESRRGLRRRDRERCRREVRRGLAGQD